jgi:hypothetical protein
MDRNSNVVVLVGLSGSGKSHLMNTFGTAGYLRFDDINNGIGGDAGSKLDTIKELTRSRTKVVVSDVLFCKPDWHFGLEKFLSVPIHWVCFENNPDRCKMNCVIRSTKISRNLQLEFQLIDELAPLYEPWNDIHEVHVSGTAMIPDLAPFELGSLIDRFPFPR